MCAFMRNVKVNSGKKTEFIELLGRTCCRRVLGGPFLSKHILNFYTSVNRSRRFRLWYINKLKIIKHNSNWERLVITTHLQVILEIVWPYKDPLAVEKKITTWPYKDKSYFFRKKSRCGSLGLKPKTKRKKGSCAGLDNQMRPGAIRKSFWAVHLVRLQNLSS